MEEAQEIAQSSSAVEQQKINKLTEENKILQQLLSKVPYTTQCAIRIVCKLSYILRYISNS